MFLVGGDGRSPSSPGMHDGLPPLSARSWRISSSSVMDDLRMVVVVVVVCFYTNNIWEEDDESPERGDEQGRRIDKKRQTVGFS